MKKSIFYLMGLLCSLSTLVSCSSDNDDNGDTKDLSVYAGTYSGENLDLSISDAGVSDKEVTIDKAGVMTLKYVVPGEGDLQIPLQEVNGNLEGTATFTGGTVSVKGLVAKSKLDVNVSIEMKNNLVGTWTVKPYISDDFGDVTSNPIFVNATPDDMDVTFMGQPLKLSNVSTFMSGILGAYAQELKSLEFRADGFIVCKFTKETTPDSPLGIVQYYVKDNMVYIVANISAMMGGTTTRGLDDLLALMTQVSTVGIPMIYSVENNTLKAYVNKEMMAPYMQLINDDILPMLPDDGIMAMAKTMIPELIVILKDCTTFNLGMELTK